MVKNLARLAKQFVKFGMVGVSNTLISYGIEMLCYYLLFAQSEMGESAKILTATALGFVVSVSNSYYWNNRFVFVSEHKKSLKEHAAAYLRMTLCYASTGLVLAPLLKLYVSSLGVAYWLLSMGVLMITIPLNFVLNKFWAFRKRSGV